MKIAIGNDHAGVEYKNILKAHLEKQGHVLTDFGTDDTKSCDYTDYADRVTSAVLDGRADYGVLICGTGIGMSMAANRHKGIRAALCENEFMARMARKHNDSNVLCLGARVTGTELMLSIADVYFSTDFAKGPGSDRHLRRIRKLDK